jgi:hypothetical protein
MSAGRTDHLLAFRQCLRSCILAADVVISRKKPSSPANVEWPAPSFIDTVFGALQAELWLRDGKFVIGSRFASCPIVFPLCATTSTGCYGGTGRG